VIAEDALGILVGSGRLRRFPDCRVLQVWAANLPVVHNDRLDPAEAVPEKIWFRRTVSPQGLCYFLRQRLAHDAQAEIAKYAKATCDLTVPLWPTTIREMGRPKK
jgi:hypothetical protein